MVFLPLLHSPPQYLSPVSQAASRISLARLALADLTSIFHHSTHPLLRISGVRKCNVCKTHAKGMAKVTSQVFRRGSPPEYLKYLTQKSIYDDKKRKCDPMSKSVSKTSVHKPISSQKQDWRSCGISSVNSVNNVNTVLLYNSNGTTRLRSPVIRKILRQRSATFIVARILS